MFTLSEIGLYICYSLLMGSFFLQLVPEDKKPRVGLPRKIQLLAIAGVACFTFMPVLRVIQFFMADMNIPFSQLIGSVLLTFGVGKAWLISLIVCFVLFFIVWKSAPQQGSKDAGLLKLTVTVGLILIMGWASHAASISERSGFLSHSLHVLAISLWLGIVLVVGWFTKEGTNWEAFLSWFHPVAMACAAVTLVAGLLLTLFIAPDYVNATILPYGQALLIKHVLFIPLILFGFVGGYLLKHRVREQPGYSPVSWLRAESFFVLGIFAATGYMGQQAPPHNVALTLQMTTPSPLFTFLYQGQLTNNPALVLAATPIGICLLVVTLLFASMVVFSYVRKMPTLFSAGMGFLTVVSGYFAVMMSIR